MVSCNRSGFLCLRVISGGEESKHPQCECLPYIIKICRIQWHKTRYIPNKVCISCSTQFNFKLCTSNRFDSSIPRHSCTLTAEDESNRFEIHSLKLNCVQQLCTHLIRNISSFIFAEIISWPRIQWYRLCQNQWIYQTFSI